MKFSFWGQNGLYLRCYSSDPIRHTEQRLGLNYWKLNDLYGKKHSSWVIEQKQKSFQKQESFAASTGFSKLQTWIHTDRNNKLKNQNYNKLYDFNLFCVEIMYLLYSTKFVFVYKVSTSIEILYSIKWSNLIRGERSWRDLVRKLQSVIMKCLCS